jgi:uncharacterized protein (TIGR02271 family)
MSHEKIVAVYDTAAHAEAAVSTLKSAGYPASDISVIKSEESTTDSALSEPGFWQRLFGNDIGLHEAQIYGQTVRQGGAVVAVRVLESDSANLIDLLDAHKPVDLVDRARARGLSQTPKVMVPPPTSRMATPSRVVDKDEDVVRLAEEQLDVGKRKVQSGKTRVRRYVVERPVEANVTLHEEHVEVLRRAVSEPGYTKDIDWSEQVVEVSETAEQPVVNKTLRVTEEVVIRKKGSDHIETIHDTVRRQQLDIERVPLETVKK